MKLKQVASTSVAMAAVLAFGAQAVAQTPTPTPVTGPVLPGICVFNPQRAVFTSAAGVFLGRRLGELGAQVNSELQPEATLLAADEKTLEAQRATLTQAQFQTKATAFETRVQAFQRKRQLRSIQLQLTKARAVQKIENGVGPVAQQTFTQRGCSVMIDTQALVLAVPGADLTDTVIAGVNAHLPTVPVDLATEQDAMQVAQQQAQQQQ
jgi:Skp family chaperone for outer membrane proteins